MKTLEKIYIRAKKPVNGMAFGEFYPNQLSFCNEDEPKLANYVEYIRSDIAEQMAKDFKCFKEEFMKYSVEDEFTEFLNSRKK
jgi:hypothetical protein